MFKKITLVVTIPLIVAAAVIAASPSTGATDASSCIDASKKSNLVYTWTGYDKIEVSTKDGKAPCADANLYFSAYVMPTTWDKKGWNETAIPQTLHRSVNVKLEAGKTDQKIVVNAQMPSECKNVQIDLYYAPEQKVITKTEQIGARLVTAKHKVGTGECVVVTPQQPAASVAETPSKGETVLPVELPRTGASLVSTLLVALSATGVYAAALRFRK